MTSGPHVPLNFSRAFHRVHDAGKFDEHAVTGLLDDAPLMLGDRWIDQLGTVALEIRKGADLVHAHQPAIADDVGSKDGGQTAFHRGSGPQQRLIHLTFTGSHCQRMLFGDGL